MKKNILATLAFIFSLMLPVGVLATSGYSGTSITPEDDGSYEVIGEAGDDITLTETGNLIDSIAITLEGDVNSSVTVTATADKPADAPSGVPGIIYMYIDIDGDDLNAAMESAIIRFTVTKEWLNTNNIAQDNVTLYHNVNGTWTAIATTQVSETATTVTYSATTTSFSYFAVSGSESTTAATGANLYLYIALAISFLAAGTLLASKSIIKES